MGDSLHKATEGYLKSSVHRDGNPTPGGKERLSVSYYLQPMQDSELYMS